ncbi:MAG: STAS domain-containing protein, partial [Alphaproteobacteria bacterium]
MPSTPGDLEARQRDGSLHLGATGDWTIETATKLHSRIQNMTFAGKGDVVLDLAQLGRLDSTGAWLVLDIRQRAETADATIRTEGATEAHTALLNRIEALGDCAPVVDPEFHPLIALVERTGRAAY